MADHGQHRFAALAELRRHQMPCGQCPRCETALDGQCEGLRWARLVLDAAAGHRAAGCPACAQVDSVRGDGAMDGVPDRPPIERDGWASDFGGWTSGTCVTRGATSWWP